MSRRKLAAEAAETRGLMDDDAAAGLVHGLDDGVDVERNDRAQVDKLSAS